jgi:hypothetical protein
MPTARRGLSFAVLGLALVLLGVLGYFVVVFQLGARLPGVRNHAIPSWLLVAAGIVASGVALRRTSGIHRVASGVILGANIILATALASFLYVMLAVPEATGPSIGGAAPDFVLPDQTRKTVRLADFAGHPLLLVFYRGHW